MTSCGSLEADCIKTCVTPDSVREPRVKKQLNSGTQGDEAKTNE